MSVPVGIQLESRLRQEGIVPGDAEVRLESGTPAEQTWRGWAWHVRWGEYCAGSRRSVQECAQARHWSIRQDKHDEVWWTDIEPARSSRAPQLRKPEPPRVRKRRPPPPEIQPGQVWGATFSERIVRVEAIEGDRVIYTKLTRGPGRQVPGSPGRIRAASLIATYRLLSEDSAYHGLPDLPDDWKPGRWEADAGFGRVLVWPDNPQDLPYLRRWLESEDARRSFGAWAHARPRG